MLIHAPEIGAECVANRYRRAPFNREGHIVWLAAKGKLSHEPDAFNSGQSRKASLQLFEKVRGLFGC